MTHSLLAYPPSLVCYGCMPGPNNDHRDQVPPQVVIPHVDPLHLHVGPEGVGDPEKALRLDFKALQPLNPPEGRRGSNRLSWAILWPVGA